MFKRFREFCKCWIKLDVCLFLGSVVVEMFVVALLVLALVNRGEFSEVPEFLLYLGILACIVAFAAWLIRDVRGTNETLRESRRAVEPPDDMSKNAGIDRPPWQG